MRSERTRVLPTMDDICFGSASEDSHKGYSGNLGYFDRSWLYFVKPNLYFPTNKEIRIIDWRLAVLFRGLQATIILYFLYGLVYGQEYLKTDDPGQVLSLYVSDGTALALQEEKAAIQIAGSDPGPDNYCNRLSSYDFIWSENWAYIFNICIAPFVGDLAQKGQQGASFFFSTVTEQTRYQRFENVQGNRSDAHCLEIFSQHDASWNIPCLDTTDEWRTNFHTRRIAHYTRGIFDELDGSNRTMCVCEASRGVIKIGADKAILYIDHYYRSSMSTGAHTKTYVRTYGNSSIKRVFEEGDTLSMTLEQILEYTEVELDKRSDEGLNKQWMDASTDTERSALQGPAGAESGLYPFVRISGLRVEVSMNYYNYGLERTSVERQADQTVDNSQDATVCVMEFRPYFVWTSQGHAFVDGDVRMNELVDNYNYGVLVTFHSGGVIGGFDGVLLLTALTQAIVMSGVATSVTTFAAHYLLGKKSVLYKSVLSERLDALSLYSKFATQAIMASLLYDIIDHNGSGRIGKFELYKQLRRPFCRSMNGEQIGTLVEFIIYMAHLQHIPKVDSNGEECDSDSGSEVEELLQVATPSGKLQLQEDGKRARTSGRHRHINRSQWISVITGPPCTLQQCIDVINRKFDQGHFMPTPAEMNAYTVFENSFSTENSENQNNIFDVISEGLAERAGLEPPLEEESPQLNLSLIFIKMQEMQKQIDALAAAREDPSRRRRRRRLQEDEACAKQGYGERCLPRPQPHRNLRQPEAALRRGGGKGGGGAGCGGGAIHEEGICRRPARALHTPQQRLAHMGVGRAAWSAARATTSVDLIPSPYQWAVRTSGRFQLPDLAAGRGGGASHLVKEIRDGAVLTRKSLGESGEAAACLSGLGMVARWREPAEAGRGLVMAKPIPGEVQAPPADMVRLVCGSPALRGELASPYDGAFNLCQPSAWQCRLQERTATICVLGTGQQAEGLAEARASALASNSAITGLRSCTAVPARTATSANAAAPSPDHRRRSIFLQSRVQLQHAQMLPQYRGLDFRAEQREAPLDHPGLLQSILWAQQQVQRPLTEDARRRKRVDPGDPRAKACA
ncbi:hypothetical protein CYMTET_50778 [Cymbomonas tetramitiformis]|uniref:EF-hand domain-containing protein n=1 Tax=Cymbomonas tetramitiformis TaxID=36881 RepID=A0AAE0BNK8_9CHLO|nr:hypothetical protein CYMTET_50778 [Cymbomonas tetramitiformis]